MMRISHGALVIAKRSKIHGLYILEGFIVIAHASVSSIDILDITKLWHLRLGHVSERGLVELAKQGLLGNEKLNKLYFCDKCISMSFFSYLFSKLTSNSSFFMHIFIYLFFTFFILLLRSQENPISSHQTFQFQFLSFPLHF